MYGIVLWKNVLSTRAVVWCEADGALAYYTRPANEAPVLMDAGDLVQFEVATIDRHLRVVNPRLIVESVVKDVKASIDAAQPQHRGDADMLDTALDCGSNIVNFPERERAGRIDAGSAEPVLRTVNRP